MTAISPDFAARIAREHFVCTPLVPADLGFVFGSRQGVAQRVAETVRLWHEGFFRHCIVSGGATGGIAETECAVITRGLIDGGVPAGVILQEHRATHTGENVTLSLPILEAAVELSTIGSVICIGSIHTARRYPMTVHRHWPQPVKMLACVNYYDWPAARWHEHPQFRADVLREHAKIAPYLAAGYIAPWP